MRYLSEPAKLDDLAKILAKPDRKSLGISSEKMISSIVATIN